MEKHKGSVREETSVVSSGTTGDERAKTDTNNRCTL